MLTIDELRYDFGSRTLFEGVSFHIARGEHAMLIGPNGSGKTTVLRCILRILNEWSGSILLDGVSIKRLSRRKTARSIAYVQQSYTSAFSLSVRQYVEMGRFPHLHPLTPLSQRDLHLVEDAMKAMAVEHFADRLLESLSGGERQKVLLAAALAQEPDILLLDEPTTFLDYKHQEEIYRFLRHINRERQTTILEITHDVNRAALDATHIIALSGGRVAFDGPPEKLMTPEQLGTIFDTRFELVPHPSRDRQMILPGSAALPSEPRP